MSSEDINSFPDNFFIPKENNNFFHSFTEEEDEHFEPFSNNFLIDESFKEKIGSIDGKLSSSAQMSDENPMPSPDEIRDIIIPNNSIKDIDSISSGESSNLFIKKIRELISVEIETFLPKKRSKERRPRKDYRDNIRVKIKRGFYRSLRKKLNQILKNSGSKKCFDFFPYKFSSDVNKERNKYILDMTLKEIFLNKKLYEFEDKNGLYKYKSNFDLVQNEEIKNNEKLQKILNKTFRELYEDYINSDDFNIDEINRLKNNKTEDEQYIETYKILSKNLINFFSH
jgi:hypothetical protein